MTAVPKDADSKDLPLETLVSNAGDCVPAGVEACVSLGVVEEDTRPPRVVGGKHASLSDERRCLASGEMKSREEMIRFVIAPDKTVVPDLSENLPGRGLWVTATPEAIRLAVKKNLFAKAAKGVAHPSPTLADEVTRLLRKRCCTFLGLAKGAGVAMLGESQTEGALRARKLALFFHAPDATRTLDNRSCTPECALFSRDEMGAAFGYDQIVYAGLLPHGLTEKLKRELNRLVSMLAEPENEVCENPQVSPI